jgi:hypothetical protein
LLGQMLRLFTGHIYSEERIPSHTIFGYGPLSMVHCLFCDCRPSIVDGLSAEVKESYLRLIPYQARRSS